MAIPGLYSHWVTENILAMARPNTAEVENHDMIQSFVKSGIQSVFNLQENGEHAHCGAGNHSSGFSYDPQNFMDAGIFCYNFNCKDYAVPLLRTILDICQVMSFALESGKLAVHCHAGLGRTGVVIACFLIYYYHKKPKEAILTVRRNRPRSIQTRNQLKAVLKFAQFISPLRIQFSHIIQYTPDLSLGEILANQQLMLHGQEGRTLKYIPKYLYTVCWWLLGHLGCNREDKDILYTSLRSISNTCPAPVQQQQFEGDCDSLGSLADKEVEGDETEVDAVEEELEEERRVTRHPSFSTLPGQLAPIEDRLANTPIVDDQKLLKSKVRQSMSSSSMNLEVLPQISNVSERLHLSPRLSKRLSNEGFIAPCTEQLLDIPTEFFTPIAIYNAAVSEASEVELKGFMRGLREGAVTKEVVSVMTDVNSGDWSKMEEGEGEVLGVVTRLWFENLTCPLLTQFEVDMIVMKSEVDLSSTEENMPQLANLNTSLNNLTRAQVGVLHCLITTFTLVMQGPLRDSKEEVLQTLANLILQDNRVTGSASAAHDILKSGDTSCRVFCRKTRDPAKPTSGKESPSEQSEHHEPLLADHSAGETTSDGEVVKDEDVTAMKNSNKKFCRVLQLLMTYKYRTLIGDIV